MRKIKLLTLLALMLRSIVTTQAQEKQNEIQDQKGPGYYFAIAVCKDHFKSFVYYMELRKFYM